MTATRPPQSPDTVVYAFLDFGDGGAQRLALTTWRHLDRERFRPVLMCVRRRGSLVSAAEALDVPVEVVGRLNAPFDVSAVPAIASRLRRLRASIVHVPLYTRASPYVRLAALLAQVPVTVAHEHCRGRPPSRLRAIVDRALAPGTKFVAVSEAMRTELVASGVPAGAVTVVGNGVDTTLYAPRARGPARRSLGLAPDVQVLLVPARLEPRKGHTVLLAALPALASGHPRVMALCAGGGPYDRAFRALSTCAGLDDRVRWLGHRDDMPELYAASDLVCLPSRTEGMPLAILEAMASGRAVVAARAGGVPEVVAHSVTGRLVAPDDPAGLAAAVAAILDDDGARSAMEQEARRLALERHRSEDMTARLQSAYAAWLLQARSEHARGRAA